MNFEQILEGIHLKTNIELIVDGKEIKTSFNTDIDLSIEDSEKITDILTESFLRQIGLREEQAKYLMKRRCLKSATKTECKGEI